MDIDWCVNGCGKQCCINSVYCDECYRCNCIECNRKDLSILIQENYPQNNEITFLIKRKISEQKRLKFVSRRAGNSYDRQFLGSSVSSDASI
jgi:hypothetical protein